MKQVVSLVIVSVFIISLGCFVEAKDNGKTEQPVAFPQNAIAMVNGDVISDAELRERLSAKHKNVSEITSDSVEEALDDLINRRLIIQEAYRMALDEDPLIVQDRKKFIRIQSIIGFRGDFSREATASEEEIQDVIKEQYEKREVEVLFTEDEEKAEHLFSLVQDGRAMESLNEEAKHWKGAISRETYGKGSPVSQGVFRSEIGKLLFVKEEKGVFIIRIKGEVSLPKETREQLATSIEKNLRNQKSKQALEAFLSGLKEKAVIDTDSELLRELEAEKLLKDKDKEWMFDSRVIARINDEPITVSTFLEKYKGYLLPHLKHSEKPQEEKNKQAMETVIRITLEAQAALAKGYYEKSVALREMVKKHQERVMLNFLYKKLVLPLIELSEEKLRSYYQDNIKTFSNPGKVALKGILVKDKADAEKLLRELRRGANINYLSENFSLRHPYDGWKLNTDLPDPVAGKVRELDVGGISDIIPLQNSFLIVKVVGRKDGEPRPFPSVQNVVRSRYIGKKGKELIEELAARMREKSEIRINTLLLADFQKTLSKSKTK